MLRKQTGNNSYTNLIFFNNFEILHLVCKTEMKNINNFLDPYTVKSFFN